MKLGRAQRGTARPGPGAGLGAGSGAGAAAALGWAGIVRLGLVQAALGSVVVLVTSTLNRVMVVEYALPALLPGALVAWHYAVQMIRPRFGFGADRGRRRTPWILGGMAALCCGGVLCAVATAELATAGGLGLVLAVLGYALVGLGVGAAGTSLLVLMAARVDPSRRAAAATLMWVLMIAGFAVTSTVAGHFLDPYSARRLIVVAAAVACVAFLVAVCAVWRIERAAPPTGRQPDAPDPRDAPNAPDLRALPDLGALPDLRAAPGTGALPELRAAPGAAPAGSFAAALRAVWSEPESRAFTVFVFVSMLAYSAQELLLEPFFGLVFGYSVGASARLAGLWHASVLMGMIAVGVACSGARRLGSLRAWTIGGCCASALALSGLVCADWVGAAWPLTGSVLALGVANGVFAVAAIGSMMELGGNGAPASAGTRMGLWGAAQAVAFALGGIFGTAILDLVRHFRGPTLAFGSVFTVEALLFLVAAAVATRVGSLHARRPGANFKAVTA